MNTESGGVFRTMISLAVLCLFIFGCGHHYKRVYLQSESAISVVRVVGVLPFENLTKFPDTGEIVADLFTTELYRQHRFKIMERTKIQKYLDEHHDTLPEVIDRTYAQELGSKLGLDGVFIGSVSEYWYRLDRRSYRYMDEWEEPAVGINARLVQVSTGEVIWAASSSRSSRDIFSVDRDHINRISQITLREMAKSLE